MVALYTKPCRGAYQPNIRRCGACIDWGATPPVTNHPRPIQLKNRFSASSCLESSNTDKPANQQELSFNGIPDPTGEPTNQPQWASIPFTLRPPECHGRSSGSGADAPMPASAKDAPPPRTGPCHSAQTRTPPPGLRKFGPACRRMHLLIQVGRQVSPPKK